MIDLIIVLICSYQLHRMAVERGLSPWPYVGQYVGLFILMGITMAYAIVWAYGKDFMQNDEAISKVVYFEPFAILFEVFTFIWFRRRIASAEIFEDDDQDDSPPSDGKKDLSYFR